MPQRWSSLRARGKRELIYDIRWYSKTMSFRLRFAEYIFLEYREQD